MIRAALPHLKAHAGKFYTFFTLSTPHLGTSRGSKLIKLGIHLSSITVGIKIARNVASEPSLDQIAFRDSKKDAEKLLYRLSETEGLEWFKNIVPVCASPSPEERSEEE